MAICTYTRTFQTSEFRRMDCDGYRGEYVSMDWQNSGYTVSGGSVVPGRPCTVTITMEQVTATWFNNAGGCSYNFYIDLYTSYGMYTSEVINYAWPKGGGNLTMTFEIPNVIGEWTNFVIWGQNWTFSEKKTEYPYVYWFNNNDGNIIVSYAEGENLSTMAFVRTANGEWKTAVPYVFTTSRHIYEYPEVAMTSANSQNCIASASSTYSSSYPVWRCFDKNTTSTAWASSTSASGPWVQLQIPRQLYDITVTITNRGDRNDNIRGPIAGYIEGSNDASVWDIIYTFSDRDGATKLASTIYNCTNNSTGYSYIRVRMTDWYPSGNHTYCSIGEITISGYDIPSTGGYQPASYHIFTNNSWV